MSDTVKLVVTISKDQYEICKQALKDVSRDRPITECEFAIATGTPLVAIKTVADVKEEIANATTLHMGMVGYVEVEKAIKILDNIVKSESEEN